MPGCVSNSMLREGVFGYSRSPSRGFGRMKFCWSSSFECLQIEPNNPCGDKWNPLPLWSLALMHCFLRESLCTDSTTMSNVQNWRWCQSITDLENWNINYYRTDMCQPMFSHEFEISPIFNLNRCKRATFYDNCTTKPLVHFPLVKQTDIFAPMLTCLDLDSHYTHFRSLKQHWESSRGHSNKPTAGMVGGRCRLLGWGFGKHTCATTTHSMGSVLQTHVVKVDLIIEPIMYSLKANCFWTAASTAVVHAQSISPTFHF